VFGEKYGKAAFGLSQPWKISAIRFLASLLQPSFPLVMEKTWAKSKALSWQSLAVMLKFLLTDTIGYFKIF